MSDRSRVLGAAFAGAAIGGIWGWFYMTDRGRLLRDRIDPVLNRLAGAVGKAYAARTAIVEGRNLLKEARTSRS